jgi:hypothetical protein
MITWLQTKAFGLLLAAVPIGLLASMGYQFLKKVIERETALLDKTPAAVHRIYFGLTAVVITALAGVFGITVECDPGASCLSAVTQDHLKLGVEAVLAILVGSLAHHAKKRVGA